MLNEAPKKEKKLKYGEVTHAINLDQNLQSVLQQITSEMKMAGNKLAAKYDLPWRELEYCNISFTGKEEGQELTMKVENRKGGFRVGRSDPTINSFNAKELQSHLQDIRKILKNFEKALKKEFKERTGKALRLTKPKEFANYELVAANGLYRFFAIKVAEVDASLEEPPEYK